jgi:DNA-binding NarL/FixJ family response regulator
MSGSVLVVDDDPAFRRLAGRMLAVFDLIVLGEAATVADGRAAAASLKPDAVLLDIRLPDGDGLALARELSDLPWSPRVLLTSSDAEAALPAEVERSGAVGFVPKDELPNAPLNHLLGPIDQPLPADDER